MCLHHETRFSSVPLILILFNFYRLLLIHNLILLPNPCAYLSRPVEPYIYVVLVCCYAVHFSLFPVFSRTCNLVLHLPIHLSSTSTLAGFCSSHKYLDDDLVSPAGLQAHLSPCFLSINLQNGTLLASCNSLQWHRATLNRDHNIPLYRPLS